MLIRSMAGDFEITISEFAVEQGRMVMVGRMGVWDARTYITPREVLSVFGKLLNPRILFYFLQLPFLAMARKPNQPVTEQGDDT